MNGINPYIPYSHETAAIDQAFMEAAKKESRFYNLDEQSNTYDRLSEMLINESALLDTGKEVVYA